MTDEYNPVTDLVNLQSEGVDLSDPKVASVVSNAIRTLSYCSDTMALLILRLNGGKTPYPNIRSTFDSSWEE